MWPCTRRSRGRPRRGSTACSAASRSPRTTRSCGSAAPRRSPRFGGAAGRRAAVDGLASVALTSGVVNLVLKPLGGRRRPDRAAHAVPPARYVAMPRSTSFPSGHAASAFAFATGVAATLPGAGVALNLGAAIVAYSRVHTGVHYPGDVIAGSVAGGSLAPVVVALRRKPRGS